MDNVRPLGKESDTSERETSSVQWNAVTRLKTVLKDIREREVAAANANGQPMNFGSWQSRLADELSTPNERIPESTIANWIHGEAFPEWPRLEKLVGRFGAELRNSVLPCSDGGSYQDGWRDCAEHWVRTGQEAIENGGRDA